MINATGSFITQRHHGVDAGGAAGDFLEHATARATAMLLRDRKAESGAPSDDDWRTIAGLLDQSWMALQIAVGP